MFSPSISTDKFKVTGSGNSAFLWVLSTIHLYTHPISVHRSISVHPISVHTPSLYIPHLYTHTISVHTPHLCTRPTSLHRFCVALFVQFPLHIRTNNDGCPPSLNSSLYLHHVFRNQISKYSHIFGYDFNLGTVNWGGKQWGSL